MTTELPSFRYHVDPLASGSVEPSDATCDCCGRARGFVYVGPVYCEESVDLALCPWCIASGEANRRYDATFVDSEAFDDQTAAAQVGMVVERTPGFNSWQPERWLSCCGEPAAFVTPAGISDIRSRFRYQEATLMTYIVHELGISGGAANRLLERLSRDAGPTAYVFKCLHCDNYPAYVDGG